jgi:hypothetical protein
MYKHELFTLPAADSKTSNRTTKSNPVPHSRATNSTMDASEQDTSFPIVIALSLWIRDPLFIAKNPITNSSIIFYVSADISYVELEIEINLSIDNEKLTAWKFIDWTRYSVIPLEIRSRSFQQGGNRPVEQVLTTDQDVKEALEMIQNDESGDHLAVAVTMYEGSRPPTPAHEDEGIEISAYQNGECEVCGHEHGIGECRAANGGIRLEQLGDENGEGEGGESPIWGPDDHRSDGLSPNWDPDQDQVKDVNPAV